MCIYVFKIDASCQRAEFSTLQINFLSRYSSQAAAEATLGPALFYFFNVTTALVLSTVCNKK